MRVIFRSLLEMYAKSINPAISAVFVLAIAICPLCGSTNHENSTIKYPSNSFSDCKQN